MIRAEFNFNLITIVKNRWYNCHPCRSTSCSVAFQIVLFVPVKYLYLRLELWVFGTLWACLLLLFFFPWHFITQLSIIISARNEWSLFSSMYMWLAPSGLVAVFLVVPWLDCCLLFDCMSELIVPWLEYYLVFDCWSTVDLCLPGGLIAGNKVL